MKSSTVVFAACAIALAGFVAAQDPDTDQQIKEAQEAAKKMGVKMPDMQKLMDESAREEAADEAAKAAATPSPDNAVAVSSPSASPMTISIPTGTAKGSLTFDRVTSELKFASAFVDEKDERKPVVLVVSDEKLPTDKWSSEFDMMRHQTKWSGVVFFLDQDGTAYRTDVHTKGRQASVSGIFDLKINDAKSKDLGGVAKTETSNADQTLDVTFHATRN